MRAQRSQPPLKKGCEMKRFLQQFVLFIILGVFAIVMLYAVFYGAQWIADYVNEIGVVTP